MKYVSKARAAVAAAILAAPFAASAQTVTSTDYFVEDGWTGSGSILSPASFAQPFFSTVSDGFTANIVLAQTSGVFNNAVVTLNGTWTIDPTLVGAPFSAQTFYTFDNAVYTISAGDQLQNLALDCGGYGFDLCSDVIYGSPAPNNVIIDPPNQTVPGFFSKTDSIPLTGGAASCANQFGGPCAAGLQLDSLDFFNIGFLVDFSGNVFGTGPVVTVDSNFSLGWLTDTGNSGYILQGTIVPIPAAAWLFLSALGLVGWMRRRVPASA